jgi:hypothetical protein
MGLIEAVVALGVFSLMSLLLSTTLIQSFAAWNRASSRQAADHSLYKAQNSLSRDLTLGAPDLLGTQVALSTLGSPDGDAVWFLSFIDPATELPVYETGLGSAGMGEPRWQRNILYYSVVPANHDSYAGQACAGGLAPDGYEDHCPHKVLVRKVINGPDDSEGRELLLGSVAGYLDRPSGLDVSAMGGPGVEDVKIISRDILGFRVTNNSPEVVVDLRANAILETRKLMHVGYHPLSRVPTTLQRIFSVYPKNPGQAPP